MAVTYSDEIEWKKPKIIFSNWWPEALKTSIFNFESEKSKMALELKNAKQEKVEAKNLEAKNLKNLGFQIKKLSFKEDDILLVHLTCNPKPGLATLVQQLAVMASVKKLKVSILVLPKEIDISNIDEKEMNAKGWYKRGHRLVRPDV